MDYVNLIIGLVSGIVGGNIAGGAMKEKGLGAVGNSITGFLGGGLGALLLQALNLYNQPGDIDIGSILSNVGSGGVGGAILMLIVAFIKNAVKKSK